ncbi:HAD family hydrolase [Ectobacillus sp. JY-23]|uniref:Cof-type HAD-IIB family hydrolase n=1 Tax=Ectobacillus sp. JY-23 TaxID=2933872 RepID=UPI001FF42FA9|nr:Cof-type HAD-IIB family hydrolase [Ectobacillus sp. JY-23]UOY93855.1 HAD family hydrolase [Ectobacillus sp. JY-23]
MVRLFVSDLDDTLVYQINQVCNRDKRALQWLSEQGTDICFASGRFAHRIHHAVRDLEVEYHTASLNGAVLTTKDGVLLHEEIFNRTLSQKIYKYISEKQMVHIACAGESRYTVSKNQDYIFFEQNNGLEVIEMEDLHDRLGESIFPSKFFLHGTQDEIARVDHELKDVFGHEAEVVISGPGFVDIMPAGVSKGQALQKLMKHLQVLPHQVACIGDSFNDISMFEVTPHSFSLHHAPACVKQRAAHVVRSVEEAIMKLAFL